MSSGGGGEVRLLSGHDLSRSASIAPKSSPGRLPVVVGEHEVALKKLVEANPSADSEDLATLLEAETGLQVKLRTMGNTLARLGITRKKQFKAAERDRPDVVEKRDRWDEVRGTLDPKKLAFLDETGSNRAMTPTAGWSQKGRRIIEPRPAAKGKNVTVIAVLMLTGVVAPRAFEGALNGPRFLEYARDVLVPALGPGGALVMDSLRIHYNPEAINQSPRERRDPSPRPAALLTRPEPNRTRVVEAQEDPARESSSHLGCVARRYLGGAEGVDRPGRRSLVQALRIPLVIGSSSASTAHVRELPAVEFGKVVETGYGLSIPRRSRTAGRPRCGWKVLVRPDLRCSPSGTPRRSSPTGSCCAISPRATRSWSASSASGPIRLAATSTTTSSPASRSTRRAALSRSMSSTRSSTSSATSSGTTWHTRPRTSGRS
ncbi:MAG: transposase [Deltaproteobacteria bacterium]|nr:transposase [Deltaproteobacteria bacterium]